MKEVNGAKRNCSYYAVEEKRAKWRKNNDVEQNFPWMLTGSVSEKSYENPRKGYWLKRVFVTFPIRNAMAFVAHRAGEHPWKGRGYD